MYFIDCLVGGIMLVWALAHKLLHNVVEQVLPSQYNASIVTTVSMVVVSVLVPFIPLLLCFMGASVGVISILTLGAITRKASGNDVMVQDDKDCVRTLSNEEYKVRVLEDLDE